MSAPKFTTDSGIEIKDVYPKQEIPAENPGEFPFKHAVYNLICTGVSFGLCASTPVSALPKNPTNATNIF